MDLSVIIPNYNGEEILRKNLPKVFESLLSYKGGKVEVVVIDDASIDGSLALLESLRSKIHSSVPNIEFKIIKNDKNLGFSSNVNKGVESTSGEILILLNTDVVPKQDFLIPLLSHFSDANVFAVGCMDKSVENGKTVLRGRGIGSWKRGFLIHSRGEVDKTDTLWVSGGSGAFRKSIWDKLGGFDQLYDPFYWEDIDLSYRAVKSGYKILFEPKSTVIHEHEKGVIKKKFLSSKIKSIAYRNQFIFIWKNITDINFQLFHLFWLPYHLVKALIKGDTAFFIGFFTALFRLPKIIKASIQSQKLFILKDSKLLFL